MRNMELREINSKEEMLKNFEILSEVYPTLTTNHNLAIC